MNYNKFKRSAESIKMPDDVKKRITENCVNTVKSTQSNDKFTDHVFTVEHYKPNRFRRIAGIAAVCAVVAGAGIFSVNLMKNGIIDTPPAATDIAENITVKSELNETPFDDMLDLMYGYYDLDSDPNGELLPITQAKRSKIKSALKQSEYIETTEEKLALDQSYARYVLEYSPIEEGKYYQLRIHDNGYIQYAVSETGQDDDWEYYYYKANSDPVTLIGNILDEEDGNAENPVSDFADYDWLVLGVDGDVSIPETELTNDKKQQLQAFFDSCEWNEIPLRSGSKGLVHYYDGEIPDSENHFEYALKCDYGDGTKIISFTNANILTYSDTSCDYIIMYEIDSVLFKDTIDEITGWYESDYFVAYKDGEEIGFDAEQWDKLNNIFSGDNIKSIPMPSDFTYDYRFTRNNRFSGELESYSVSADEPAYILYQKGDLIQAYITADFDSIAEQLENIFTADYSSETTETDDFDLLPFADFTEQDFRIGKHIINPLYDDTNPFADLQCYDTSDLSDEQKEMFRTLLSETRCAKITEKEFLAVGFYPNYALEFENALLLCGTNASNNGCDYIAFRVTNPETGEPEYNYYKTPESGNFGGAFSIIASMNSISLFEDSEADQFVINDNTDGTEKIYAVDSDAIETIRNALDTMSIKRVPFPQGYSYDWTVYEKKGEMYNPDEMLILTKSGYLIHQKTFFYDYYDDAGNQGTSETVETAAYEIDYNEFESLLKKIVSE